MKRDRLSGIAALRHALAARLPRALRERTVLEPLEPRMLYSADAAGSLSPLLTGTAAPQSTVLGLSPVQRVEVATVRATGSVGPFVRIDVAQLQELRAEAVARREALFERAGGRSPDGSSTVDVLGSSISPGDTAADRASKVAARAARVAAAWNRIQDAIDAGRDARNGDTTTGRGSVGSPSPVVEGGETTTWTDQPAEAPISDPGLGGATSQSQDSTNPIIAIIDRGSVIPLNPYRDPVVDWTPTPDVLGSVVGGSFFDAVVNVNIPGADGFASASFRGATGAPLAVMASTSAETGGYQVPARTSADPEADLQAMDAAAGGAAAGGAAKTARPTVAVVGRSEEDEFESRRTERHHGLAAGRDHESVIATDGGIVGDDGAAAATVASAGARGLVTLAGISTVASLLAGGAGGVGGAAGAATENASIVVAPNGLAAIAAAADIAAPALAAARAANVEGATGVVAHGALTGAQRVLELARGAASAATAVLPALPSLPEAVPAAGAGTLDIAMTPGTFLGLAPVWDWAGPSAADADGATDSGHVAAAWRVAAAGSLVITLAGCWYCVTASKRFRRGSRRRRGSDHARFATARRIRFNPQPA